MDWGRLLARDTVVNTSPKKILGIYQRHFPTYTQDACSSYTHGEPCLQAATT